MSAPRTLIMATRPLTAVMSRLRGFWPRPLIEPRGGMDWSPADFSEDALQYLLAEARQRVQEQLMFMDSQDVRTRTAFSISVLLVAAVGIIGDVSIDTRPLALLTVVAFSSSVVTWVCSWVAYRSVDVGSGVNVATLARAFGGASRREMEDATLLALVEDFERNQAVIDEKGRWLRVALYALAVQLSLLVATVIVSAI